MKINTAFTRLLVTLLFFVFPITVFAQQYQVDEKNVNVNANIQVDLYSTVTLTPESVEIYQPSTVQVRVIAPNGEYIPNRTIQIVASGVSITQPSSVTDILGRTSGSVFSGIPGTYSICAKDITFSFDIDIQACKTLYVRPLPVPTILPEPAYTKGNTNMILWQSLGSGYTYTIQASRNSDFTDIAGQAVGVSGSSYEFKNLVNEQMYFYRVKAKNLYGGESAWSNSVFSVQDSENPQIEMLSVSDVGENNTVQWKNDFVVTLVFRVSDNLALKSTSFSCVKRNSGAIDCSESKKLEGDNFTVDVRLDSLERVSGVYLYPSYSFCVEASDEAGNINKVCSTYLLIPQGRIPGEEEIPVTPPSVIDRIDKGIEDLNEALDGTIGNLNQGSLEIVSTTSSIITASAAITIAAGTLWQIPFLLMQMVLSFLSWFGFRKKGKHFGFVYDAVTKEPVSQAIVRVFDENNRMVWSDVTDSSGSFKASLESGVYTIKVRSARHSFPSSIVFGKEDYPLSNVYHGESFEITQGDEIKYAIPMDPLELSKLRMFVESIFGRFKFGLNILHILLFVGGLIASIYAYSKYPSYINFGILFLFIPSFFLIIRNIFFSRSKFGVVRDINKKRLEGVVVGLREMEFEKIVAKRVTDRDGRYRFLIGRGEYQLEVLETGYTIESIRGGNVVSVKRRGGDTIVARDIVVRDLDSK